MAPRALLHAAAADFHRTHRTRIDLRAAGGVEVARRIEAGEAADVVVLSRDDIDKLAAAGHLAGATRRDLMSSGIAAAVRAGTVPPDLSDEAALRQAVLQARSISYSTGPSGRYLESLFGRWGILEELRARIVVPAPGTPVASLVSSGAVALGFQQLSEMLDLPGVEVAGPLPAAIQHLTIFSGALSTASLEAKAAEEFLGFLASSELGPLKQRFGMTGA